MRLPIRRRAAALASRQCRQCVEWIERQPHRLHRVDKFVQHGRQTDWPKNKNASSATMAQSYRRVRKTRTCFNPYFELPSRRRTPAIIRPSRRKSPSPFDAASSPRFSSARFRGPIGRALSSRTSSSLMEFINVCAATPSCWRDRRGVLRADIIVCGSDFASSIACSTITLLPAEFCQQLADRNDAFRSLDHFDLEANLCAVDIESS